MVAKTGTGTHVHMHCGNCDTENIMSGIVLTVSQPTLSSKLQNVMQLASNAQCTHIMCY